MTIDNLPSLGALKPSQLVAEYDQKAAALESVLATFEGAGSALKMAATIGGTWGNANIDTGHVSLSTLKRSLLSSAWAHIYGAMQIERLASPNEKRKFQQSLADPAPFTLDNIRATFGAYIANPRAAILRGMAEVFCGLDPAYKSHDKVKIGVEGLPKRVILPSVGGFGSYGKDKLESILNALATYQGKPLVTWPEIDALLKDGDALLKPREIAAPDSTRDNEKTITLPARGVRLKRFGNGNGHLHFEPDTLRDINRALAEYYGDVLPDAYEPKPDKPRAGTSVSKDLQYYPTPAHVVDRVLDDLGDLSGKRVLEPSCGCGRFLDALRQRGARCVGYEVDAARANLCRAKGHSIAVGNFLEMHPTGDFDLVVMNPPFYGRHYLKHVEHALGFLKPDGLLVSILPITARHDHGVICAEWAAKHGARMVTWGAWEDLPMGAFAESGTNINTTVLKLRKV